MDDGFSFINQLFTAEAALPVEMDVLWAEGWRHFGCDFFRYNFSIHEGELRHVVPLRIRLDNFSLSRSQRRNLVRNQDLQCIIKPLEMTNEAIELFNSHKKRFSENIPSSLSEFIPEHQEDAPCEIMEVNVRNDNRLLAISYFSVGDKASSGIYAMFEPTELRRGLGIFTLLKELEFAKKTGRSFYYLGYSYKGRSFYDYKKQFRGTEAYDWINGWRPYNYQNENNSFGVVQTENIFTDTDII